MLSIFAKNNLVTVFNYIFMFIFCLLFCIPDLLFFLNFFLFVCQYVFYRQLVGLLMKNKTKKRDLQKKNKEKKRFDSFSAKPLYILLENQICIWGVASINLWTCIEQGYLHDKRNYDNRLFFLF